MPAQWVIHVVGPNYHRGEHDRALLSSCYERALQVADELGARTVAFPLISAGSSSTSVSPPSQGQSDRWQRLVIAV